jgi:hypothetical protein
LKSSSAPAGGAVRLAQAYLNYLQYKARILISLSLFWMSAGQTIRVDAETGLDFVELNLVPNAQETSEMLVRLVVNHNLFSIPP